MAAPVPSIALSDTMALSTAAAGQDAGPDTVVSASQGKKTQRGSRFRVRVFGSYGTRGRSGSLTTCHDQLEYFQTHAGTLWRW